ncbi:MAG: NB-ARC domain-containing protein [Cellvibrionaceae bacterium]
MKKFMQKLQHKLDVAKEDSDFSYFFSLLVAGEAISKIVTLISASALISNKDRHQYRILHGVVRASGIGDWSKAIDDLLVGAASQYLIPEYREFQAELTKKTPEGEWQNLAVQELEKTLESLNIKNDTVSGKRDLKSWFKLFTELRNKTRGHGALLPDSASRSVPHLEASVQLILGNLGLLSLPSAYLKRNLSGKYRVTEIGATSEDFDIYKTSSELSLEDGVYVFLGGPKKVPLLLSDADLTDFYIANGSFSNRKYELISYLTDDKKYGDSSEYLVPVGALPASESEGLGELQCVGNTFTNVPSLSYDYIQRQDLEDQLYSLLLDDRRAVVTLLGRGGIGKTSLALKVIPRLYEENRYDAIVWFSSRDIDLQAGGAKLVTAEVVSVKGISTYYSKLVLSVDEVRERNFNPIEYFQSQLNKSEIGPCLFVFDNFETTSNPLEVFKWIDTYIRMPNKVLITTRLREFLGDYPISVHGMTESESEDLIRLTASQLGVGSHLSDTLIESIYKVSSGHPYIIKILLGELSKNDMKGSLPKIIAGSDEVLIALFERTYSALNPCAQRVFLTLSSWNSSISRLVLEAVLMRSIGDPIEVEKSIDTIVQYSLAEEFKSEIDGQYFIVLPFAAMSFGAKKLKVSSLKSLISGDVKLLQKFGPAKLERKNIALAPHVTSFLSSLDNPVADYRAHKELLERIGLSYIDSLPIVSQWLEEAGDSALLEESQKFLYLYLERESSESNKCDAWIQLSSVCRKLKKPLDEIHALIESSQYSNVEFSDLSNVVNKVNHMLSTQELVLENNDVKTELLSKIYGVVSKRKSEGDAVDLSRIAWLALHLDELEDAKSLVEQGLLIDPDNRYCQKLMVKLEKSPTYG